MSRKTMTFVFFNIVLLSRVSTADEGPKGHATIRFLTETNTASLIIDTDALVSWLKPIIEAVETRFPKENQRKSIVVQITLHHDAPPEIELAGNPKLSEADIKAVKAAADSAKAPKTKVATCSLQVIALDKEGEPGDLPGLSPALKTPRERLLEQVQSASTPKALALIKQWARQEALPLLAIAGDHADPMFTGVRNLGQAVAKALADPKAPLNVEALSTRNPDFWRATLEMQQGNPLAPAVQSALLLVDGRIEWAQQIANLAGLFDAHTSGASDLLGFAKLLADTYLKASTARIEKGIEQYDKGNLPQALATFDAILKHDPKCSWALYERFHTYRTIKLKSGGAGGLEKTDLWLDARAKILASNPLYVSMAEARGQDGFFDLTRRMVLASLFKKPDQLPKDLLAFADVSLDLEAFDMAAMLYWSILTHIKPEAYDNRPLLESFLYALERLDVKDLKTQFKGDHADAFAKIEADRRKRVESALAPPEPDPAKTQPQSTTTKP